MFLAVKLKSQRSICHKSPALLPDCFGDCSAGLDPVCSALRAVKDLTESWDAFYPSGLNSQGLSNGVSNKLLQLVNRHVCYESPSVHI